MSDLKYEMNGVNSLTPRSEILECFLEEHEEQIDSGTFLSFGPFTSRRLTGNEYEG